MEEKRAPLSEMAIERKIQILRNKHMDSEVIALVKSDYEYGLTDDEIGLYLNKSYDIEQMKVLSKCLHKGVSEELLTLLKDMLTFLDSNKDYKLYDSQNRVVTTQKGTELYTHYDKVEASVRERYEKVQKQQKKTTQQKTVTTKKAR